MATLTGGTRLGPYEIVDAIGAGGMGEVYRGRDTRLDRIVAIKVLAPGLATDVTSRERFEREARAISSLNHPNICVLHDVGRERPSGSDGPAVDFLVMEFLEGETLAARLARTPSRPMTIDDALGIAIPIAAALDRAHRQGIVHRDLKPGNVMLTKSGVKLLDFGLARLSSAASGPDSNDGLGHGMVSLADLSMPTVSSPLTVKGTILGTLQYMAPEQLEGKPVDARADIFAFGGTLYEMLTGRRPFEGKSQASLIGAILDHNPSPISTYQRLSPPILDEIAARCLAKDPDERWQNVRDLQRQLEWVAAHHDLAAIATNGHGANPLRTVAIAVTMLVLGSIIAGAIAWSRWPKPPVARPGVRFVVTVPEQQAITRGGRHVVALSPDGTRLIYVADNQLYARPLSELNAVPIAGTENLDPAEPVFSPDGQWIAFWSNGSLKKIPVTGGATTQLASLSLPLGASWTGDRLLFGASEPRGIIEVPASGGVPKLVVALDAAKAEWAQSPQLISSGRAVVFALRVGNGSWDGANIVVEELATHRRTVLVEGGTDPRLLPTGELAYVREATVFAIAFDEQRLAVSGDSIPIERGIRQVASVASGAAQWGVSASGALAFLPGESGDDRTLVWVDRQGKVSTTATPKKPYSTAPSAIKVSPDGKKVAVVIEPASPAAASNLSPSGVVGDIWIWDVDRGTLTRLTVSNRAASPVWMPDGKRVCFRDDHAIRCQAADGSGESQTIATIDTLAAVRAITPDGKIVLSTLAAVSGSGPRGNDIVMTMVGPPATTRPLLNTTFLEGSPAISPDGRWIAYSSNETGRNEIYVRPFPDIEREKTQVSIDGGVEPRWSRTGDELFFSNPGTTRASRAMLVVAVKTMPTFVAGKPVTLFTPPNTGGVFDLSPDGRFLFSVLAAEPLTQRNEIIVVSNWIEELKARMKTP